MSAPAVSLSAADCPQTSQSLVALGLHAGDVHQRCGHLVDDHEDQAVKAAKETAKLHAARPAFDAWQVKTTLRGWRLNFGVRKEVTELARSLGAFGKVAANGNDIDVEIWVAGPGPAAQFLQECDRMAAVKCLHWSAVEPEQAKFPDSARFVPQYTHETGSPDRGETLTDSSLSRHVKNEATTFHNVSALCSSSCQQIHIVPAPLLKKNVKGAWMLFGGPSFMNRWTDVVGGRAHPMRLTAVKTENVVGERTQVQFTMHYSVLTEEEHRDLIRHLKDGFQHDSTNRNVTVTISVLEPDLLVQATQWRENCIKKMAGCTTSCGNSGANAWWLLEPLSAEAYPLLAPFAAPPQSPKRPRDATDAVAAVEGTTPLTSDEE